jgi:hypothetical protein
MDSEDRGYPFFSKRKVATNLEKPGDETLDATKKSRFSEQNHKVKKAPPVLIH